MCVFGGRGREDGIGHSVAPKIRTEISRSLVSESYRLGSTHNGVVWGMVYVWVDCGCAETLVLLLFVSVCTVKDDQNGGSVKSPPQ